MIEGAKQIEAKLRRLELNIAKKICRGAVTRATRPVLNVARQNAEAMVTGKMGRLISTNLRARTWKRMPIGMYARAVDLKPGVDEFIHITKDGVRHYIPNAIEYGHDSAAPIPYLRRAFESTKTQAGLTLQEQLRKGIIKEIK